MKGKHSSDPVIVPTCNRHPRCKQPAEESCSDCNEELCGTCMEQHCCCEDLK